MGALSRIPIQGSSTSKRLEPRIATYVSGGGEALCLVRKGEVGLAINYSETNMYNKYIKNAPIEIIV